MVLETVDAGLMPKQPSKNKEYPHRGERNMSRSNAFIVLCSPNVSLPVTVPNPPEFAAVYYKWR